MSVKTIKLSVVLATYNEEKNIGECLDSAKDLADEIIVFDEYSTDRTRKIAKNYGAKVFKYKHKNNFHETKQRAIDKATGDWILQLDADEHVTPKLAKEIRAVVTNCHSEFISESIPKRVRNGKKLKLFKKHQQLIEQREGSLGKKTGKVVAFFVPRLNFFLGKPIKHAGAYPDGVIRLFKNGKARLPGKSIHELMDVDGEVGWLFSNLEHHESPTLGRYFERMKRYTNYHAKRLKEKNAPKNIFYATYYMIIKPKLVFAQLFIRHKGFLDGYRGFLWSIFSSWHYPVSYVRYLKL